MKILVCYRVFILERRTDVGSLGNYEGHNETTSGLRAEMICGEDPRHCAVGMGFLICVVVRSY